MIPAPGLVGAGFLRLRGDTVVTSLPNFCLRVATILLYQAFV